MRGFIITLMDEWEITSQEAAKNCLKSIINTNSEIEPEFFEATTPKTLVRHSEQIFDHGRHVPWSWPIEAHENGYDLKTKLFMKHYPARVPDRVMSCAMSHARLWRKCVDIDEEIVILEHDAFFIRQFQESVFADKSYGAVGLNNPNGATRKASVFYKKLLELGDGLHKVPSINSTQEVNCPQGLAGNSAYIIKPWAAKELLAKYEEIGGWPNDALMCKELFPWLRVVYPFYTKIQGIASTTTG